MNGIKSCDIQHFVLKLLLEAGPPFTLIGLARFIGDQMGCLKFSDFTGKKLAFIFVAFVSAVIRPKFYFLEILTLLINTETVGEPCYSKRLVCNGGSREKSVCYDRPFNRVIS